MKEQRVNFETAKLAKEKGFNEFTNQVFNQYGKQFIFNSGLLTNHERILAPTQSLLQKWLREVHSIDVLVDKGFLSNKYSYEVLYKNDMLDSEYVFKTYEEALGKGLYEALKLI